MKTTLARVISVVLLGLLAPSVKAQCCGDCDANNEVTVNELVTSITRALEPVPCSDDNICSAASCAAQLAQCQTDLANCQSQPGGQRLPATGQTTSYGSGSDGDVQAGATLSYTDNGDGTVTDNNTGLVWEKKDDSGGIHDKDNLYTWGRSDPPYTMNGTMVTDFLTALNTPACFASHCDWRIPNVRELQTIVDYELSLPQGGPQVDAVFHNPAGCTGCTDIRLASCSCTASSPITFYWSSTTFRFTPGYAWGVYFDTGFVPDRGVKSFTGYVRAVRGGH